jgi:hypothetical protein
MSGTRVQAFAVIRLDLFSIEVEPELSVKVVEVFPDEEAAVTEAARLNEINQDKRAKYVIQATHWYPQGR